MHLFSCPDCGVFNSPDDYVDEPTLRICMHCNSHQGNIGYLGYKGGSSLVRSDRIDPMLNPADGKMYDSRSAYYKTIDKKGAYIQEESRYTKLEKPSTFNEKKFDQSFKKALEQHGL